MGWRNWSIWVKILGVVSIILIFIDTGLIIFLLASDGDPIGKAILGAILFSFLYILIGMWLVGFLLVYLKNKNKVLANTISICGLIIFGLIFLVSTLDIFVFKPFYPSIWNLWDIAGWFAWPFQLITVIFFIITTIVVNKK